MHMQDWAIAHRTFLLFSKVRWDCNFSRSFLKCDCAVALFKGVIVQSLFRKERMRKNVQKM